MKGCGLIHKTNLEYKALALSFGKPKGLHSSKDTYELPLHLSNFPVAKNGNGATGLNLGL